MCADSTRPPARRQTAAAPSTRAAALIDARIRELTDWRGPLLARLRKVICGADATIVEEWKWNVPVWSCGGIICTGETYKSAVKLTFAKGASLPDPVGLFNASLDGKVRRAIDFHADDAVDAAALGALVRAAVQLNAAAVRPPATRAKPPAKAPAKKPAKKPAKTPVKTRRAAKA